MRVVDLWNDYELLEVSDGERLERWGEYVLVRPDPQIIFNTKKTHPRWFSADAYYHRSSSGGGFWEFKKQPPKDWTVTWNDIIKLQVMLTSFKHTGVFPEQGANWKIYMEMIEKAACSVEVLNLFGYTGAASIACLKAGATVCHVDASKGMIDVAKNNCSLSGVRDKPIRFIADDCKKFIKREIRRGKKYNAIIMDPPSYGRGPSGEKWKIEDDIYQLVLLSKDILVEEPLFFAINSYTATLGPSVMQLILSLVFTGYDGTVNCDEIGIPIANTSLVIPAGSTAMYITGTKGI